MRSFCFGPADAAPVFWSRLWRGCLVLILAPLLIAMAAPAYAHNQSYATLRVQFSENGAFEAELGFHLAALLMGRPQAHLSEDAREQWGELSDDDISARSGRAADYIAGALEFYADGARFRPERVVFPEPAILREDGLVAPEDARPSAPVRVYGRFPAGAREFALAAPIDFAEVLMSLQTAYGVTVTQVLREGQVSHPVAIVEGQGVRVTIPSMMVTAYQYALLGFEHIVPRGLDHILFVLALFLLAPRWRPLAAQVTVFTLAHSATLALAVLGLVSAPAVIVEPLIAATILAVAVDNIVSRKLRPWRTLTVFGFGLLHGLGFASVLTALGLPAGEEAAALISFNIGVEFGQIAVLAAAFLAVGWFRRKTWYHDRIARPASLLIGAFGGYWMIERVMANL
jgi:hypothetical protein